MNYPDESKVLTLSNLCLLDGCDQLGDQVVVETTQHTVQGQVSYINLAKNQIKVRYDAEQAGWPAGYELQQCEVKSIRCYACCDDRYFERDNCDELLTEDLVTLLGEVPMDGHLFIYSGDLQEPTCLWKFKGTGDPHDPDNWLDQYGNFNEQIQGLPDDQLDSFLTWLASIFEGNGASFNADTVDNKIVVTVAGGGTVGTISLTITYDDGKFVFNPGDGSGNKTVQVVATGSGAPGNTDWFLYINTNNDDIYINNNGTPLLIESGGGGGGGAMSCPDVADCIASNIGNPPSKDQYMLEFDLLESELTVFGPVLYNDGSSINYSACTTGATLEELASLLNGCLGNPDGWFWEKNGDHVLLLNVPYGLDIDSITYQYSGGSPQVEVYSGPTTPGEAGVDVCNDLAVCLRDKGLIRGSSFSTRAAVENAHSSQSHASVHWRDSAGVYYTSRRDPINGWSHTPNTNIVPVASGDQMQVTASLTHSGTNANLVTFTLGNNVSVDIPEGAKGLLMFLRVMMPTGLPDPVNQPFGVEVQVMPHGGSVYNGAWIEGRVRDDTGDKGFMSMGESTVMFPDYIDATTEVDFLVRRVGGNQGAWTGYGIIKGFIL